MKLWVLFLAAVFLFTSTASYADTCCYKTNDAKQQLPDCHTEVDNNKHDGSAKKCEFECSLALLAKYAVSFFETPVMNHSNDFAKITDVSFVNFNFKAPQRPPKTTV